MSVTQSRLDAYLTAEANILARGASLRLGDRQRQDAELETIRKAISQLQAQLVRENGIGQGNSSLRYRTAVFNNRSSDFGDEPGGFR